MLRTLYTLAFLWLMLACTPKHDSSTASADSVVVTSDSASTKKRWLDLDTDNLKVYNDGDTTLAFPPPGYEGDHDLAEPIAIQSDPRVKRIGDSLIFTLANGDTKILMNNITDGEDLVSYVYQTSYPEIGQWQVFVSYYEASDFKLVDQRTGELTTLWGVPAFSPDKKYFLTTSADIDAGFVPNGFQLFTMRNGKPVELWSKEQNDWGAESLIWAPGDVVYADQIFRDPQVGELNKRVVAMRLVWRDSL